MVWLFIIFVLFLFFCTFFIISAFLMEEKEYIIANRIVGDMYIY